MSKLAFRKPLPAGAGDFIARGDERPSAATPAAVIAVPSAPKPAPASKRKGLVQRVKKGDLDRVTAYLPAELGERLRVHCAVHRVELSQAVAEAVDGWLVD